MPDEVKFIKDGRLVDPNGKDLGAAPTPNSEPAKTSDDGRGTPPLDPGTPPQAPEDTRTVAELKAALDAKGVQYDQNAKKADLQALAAEHSA